MSTSEHIFKWLDENEEWFKVSAIAKKAGIDKGNFLKFRKNKSIPEKHIIPIMNVIIPLGFVLDEVIEENNKPETKAKIESERNTVVAKEHNQPLSEKDMTETCTPKALTMLEIIEQKRQEIINAKNKKP